MNKAPIVFPKGTKEGTQNFLSKWLKKQGEAVSLYEPIAEVSTDKAIVEIPSPGSGVLAEILVEEGREISPGDELGTLTLAAEPPAGPSPEVASSPATRPLPASGLASAAPDLSPAVKLLLKKHGLDPALVTGTGRNGRITPEDVERYVARQHGGPFIPNHRVTHTVMRKSIARHLSESLLRTAPHVTTIFECDHTALLNHKARHEAAKGKITLTTYYVYALGQSAKAVPEANSRWFDDYLEIYDEVNVGIGTVTKDGGLVVPVIRDVGRLSFDELSKKINETVNRARENGVTREETTEGTITISNYGMSGALVAAPIIIHQPQSAILGVGKLEKRPKVITCEGKDSIEIRPCAYVTLTIDHRVLDGFRANAFMSAFVKTLEEFA